MKPLNHPLCVSRDYGSIKQETVLSTKRSSVVLGDEYFASMRYSSPKKYEEVVALGKGNLKLGDKLYQRMLKKTCREVVTLTNRISYSNLTKLGKDLGFSRRYLDKIKARWKTKPFKSYRSLEIARKILAMHKGTVSELHMLPRVKRRVGRPLDPSVLGKTFYTNLRLSNPLRYREMIALGKGDIAKGVILFNSLVHNLWVEVVKKLEPMSDTELSKLSRSLGYSSYYLNTARERWSRKEFTDYRTVLTVRKILGISTNYNVDSNDSTITVDNSILYKTGKSLGMSLEHITMLCNTDEHLTGTLSENENVEPYEIIKIDTGSIIIIYSTSFNTGHRDIYTIVTTMNPMLVYEMITMDLGPKRDWYVSSHIHDVNTTIGKYRWLRMVSKLTLGELRIIH